MTKKGIVKSVQSNGTWEGKYGLMYLYEVTINEDSGQYMSKSDNQTKFIKGQEVTPEESGLSKREWNELMDAFEINKKI